MKLVPLKVVTRMAYGDALAQDIRVAGPVPVYGSNGIIDTHVSANTEGPAIVIGRKGSFGKVTWAPKVGHCIDTAYYIDRRHTKANLRWLYWTLQTLSLDEATQDTGVPGLSRETAYGAKVPSLAPSMQLAIANYLDRQTAAIDALIAKKEELLGVLDRYRQAVITKAVTQGLPETPVEVLGQTKVKHQFNIIAGQSPLGSEVREEGATPFIQGSSEFGTEFPSPKYYCESAPKIAPPGALLLSVRAPVGDLNKTANTLAIGRGIAAVVAGKKVSPEYAYWLFIEIAPRLKAFVEGTTFEAITKSHIGEMPFVLFSLESQKAIASYLADAVSAIGALREKCVEQILTLKAYRAATIFSAVTGRLEQASYTPQ